MYVEVTESDARLVEPEVFSAFHVVRPTGTTPAEFAAALDAHRVGGPDGDDVLVRVDTVRALAAGRVGPGWEDDFAGMLAYAGRKGWLSPDGSTVRAHVETGRPGAGEEPDEADDRRDAPDI